MDETTSYMDDSLATDETTDYTELIAQEAFLGDTPIQVILEGLENQFHNYISTEDQDDYVDKFYTQLEESYNAINNDDEDHPQEKLDVLDHITSQFRNKISRLFQQRLTIAISSIESEQANEDEEYVIRTLYSYFILDAKKNFTNVISKYISQEINYNTDDDSEFFKAVEDALSGFSPYVTAIGPMEFIQFSGNTNVYELFDNGEVTGNFLRKYSPRLFDNEEFKCQLIAEITSRQQTRKEILYAAN